MIKQNRLIKKLVEGVISEKERTTLHQWVIHNDENLKIFTKTLKKIERENLKNFNAEEAYRKFIESITKEKSKTFSLSVFYKYAAILIITLFLGYFVSKNIDKGFTQKTIATETVLNTNNVIIKLADGATKVITSNTENLKNSNNVIVASKKGGGLSFKNDIREDKLVYNEINIPNGKTFKIELSDGTLVWLNAGTQLKFPQNFLAQPKNRTVYLKGEAYFEVSRNKNKPFIVNAEDINIEVLGTQFNVSTYENESNITTTLVEGAVNVFQTEFPKKKHQLVPNDQTKFNKESNIFSISKVNTKNYTSWIDNKLIINNLKFNDILKKLERKYDVVIINNAPSLNDEIYRGEFENESIKTILKTIAISNPFNFKINANEILITE